MDVIYTYTDEAPALATYSLLPIVETFTTPAGVRVERRDISLAGRILAQFPDRLTDAQRVPDALAELGALAKTPDANIIKLPNISASIPQLKAAIAELQAAGYDVPDYPDEPGTAEEHSAREAYDRVKGSAVNPVLREGNSDRRAPASVKAYARKHPHSMGAWSKDSASHVASMGVDDFRSTEQSVTLPRADTLRIEHVAADGSVTVLKEGIDVLEGEIVDGAVMRRRALTSFFDQQIADAKERGVLFSVHLKATMMKVSDPIIFGHATRAFFADVFGQHGEALARVGASANDGMASILTAIQALPADERAAIEAAIEDTYRNGPDLAMVDSDRGITNLHVPSDVIIDASLAAMIRSSGQMWNAAGEQQDTKAVIPDSSYADLYSEAIAFCRENGAFDPATMGTVPNVGLMAQKAEEYGSHDKTFEIEATGKVRVVDGAGGVLIEHEVEQGDIWRACQTKDAPVAEWVRLAVTRARTQGAPAVFWLDETRPHDAEVLAKVRRYLPEHDTSDLQIEILPVGEATRFTLERCARGQDTVSVTGNVLRDYLTDLFPILELGTSAKMLSTVPLMNGGGLFETGASGSAPRHVQQFVRENHLRWDSLGEYLAIAESLLFLSEKTGDAAAAVLARTLDAATGRMLEEDKGPSRRAGELDTRGSHFYLALYWAQELAGQSEDAGLREAFAPLASRLAEDEETIVGELSAVQGEPVDLGGYYFPDAEKADAAMRPSAALNAAFKSVGVAAAV
ncbi:MAG: Isocitrate dehydrogenase [NADP]; Monomeric isocitrate dehydrogenase [NADP] [uncultured Solirubrobacteraceae bacterium]|uniref:Isocitrate dehydrogenase [NADP] n=1 Tax=uncultured Solirubrobacteraceae bacterium TaxID=1162706 RepID=A0A6J4R5N8_9ACTN|nr:MAG: Isocitrate dehydrogenase [NADP]; Monomeric isocitrate dehydrogenase [NADP] [uncultured Solirubrobacteraceae bacterium]